CRDISLHPSQVQVILDAFIDRTFNLRQQYYTEQARISFLGALDPSSKGEPYPTIPLGSVIYAPAVFDDEYVKQKIKELEEEFEKDQSKESSDKGDKYEGNDKTENDESK